jgi:phospholipid/cholesterol/gamma-HCH transport system substrate-binding protein
MFEDRKKLKWKYLKVAIMLTSAILIVIMAAVFGMNVTKYFTRQEAVVYAMFDNVGGLNSGAPVRFAGLGIGSVGSMAIRADGRVKVALSLQQDKLKYLKKDAQAQILTLGLLGDKYVGITAGSQQAQPLKEGELIRGKIPAEFQDIVTATRESLSRMAQFIEKLEILVDAVEAGEGTIGKLIADPEVYRHVKTLTASLSAAATDLGRGQGTLGKLLAQDDLYEDLSQAAGDIRHFTASLRNSKGSLHRLIEDPRLYNRFSALLDLLHRFSSKLAASRGTLARLIEDEKLYENLNSTAARLDTILARIEQGHGTLGKLTAEDVLIRELREALREFKLLVTDIRFNPKRYFELEIFE